MASTRPAHRRERAPLNLTPEEKSIQTQAADFVGTNWSDWARPILNEAARMVLERKRRAANGGAQ